MYQAINIFGQANKDAKFSDIANFTFDNRANLMGCFEIFPWVICALFQACLLYTSPSPRDATLSRMPSSA